MIFSKYCFRYRLWEAYLLLQVEVTMMIGTVCARRSISTFSCLCQRIKQTGECDASSSSCELYYLFCSLIQERVVYSFRIHKNRSMFY